MADQGGDLCRPQRLAEKDAFLGIAAGTRELQDIIAVGPGWYAFVQEVFEPSEVACDDVAAAVDRLTGETEIHRPGWLGETQGGCE